MWQKIDEIKKIRNEKNNIILHQNVQTCSILREHAEKLKDDPERLSTAFIKGIMGSTRKCKGVME